MRHREDDALEAHHKHCHHKLDEPKFGAPHTKVNVLLQCHFSRRDLSRELTVDLHQVLDKSTRLLQAMVDVLSSSGYLSPALATMELCQMCVQGMWDRDPVLLQVPHFTRELAKKAAAVEVETIYDLLEMEVRPCWLESSPCWLHPAGSTLLARVLTLTLETLTPRPSHRDPHTETLPLPRPHPPTRPYPHPRPHPRRTTRASSCFK